MSSSEHDHEQREREFNPRDYVIALKSKQGNQDYLPVQWRLVWFREQCPEGTIETELVHLDLDRETEEEGYTWNNETRRSEKVIKRANGFAVFKATVKDGRGGVATGHKSEKAAAFGEYLEKAETGAIGRALASLGYGTQFAPDLEERECIVDAPVDTSYKAAPSEPKRETPPTSSRAAGSDSSVIKMTQNARARCATLGLDWEELKAEAIGYNIPDRELVVGSFVKINGLLTRKEGAAA